MEDRRFGLDLMPMWHHFEANGSNSRPRWGPLEGLGTTWKSSLPAIYRGHTHFLTYSFSVAYAELFHE